MKITNIILSAAVVATVFSSCTEQSISDYQPELITELDSVSYSIGMFMGKNMKKDGFEVIDQKVFMKAMDEMMKDEDTQIELEQAGKVLNDFVAKKMQVDNKPLIAEGEKFLADNSKKEGVTTLPSGLQYEILKEGSGAKPGLTDMVKTHYHGTLLNGKVFDSSVDRGEPATFGVTQVIAGWTEALQLMPVGSKWKLYLPYNLAYGERGNRGIAPFSTLIFEIELLDIMKKNDKGGFGIDQIK